MSRTTRLTWVALASSTMLSSGAYAQAVGAPVTPVTTAAAQPKAKHAASEEIVVTAQRRSQRLVDVPITVTALSQSTLKASGVTSTGDLGAVVPGLTMDRSGPFSQPTIRGIGSSVTGPGIGTSVATYIDGFYQPSTVTNDFELADVQSIQVLKGPQGTLFGRNATGGAILVTTLTPSFTPYATASVSYGSYNDVRVNAVYSQAITDKLAFYGALFYHRTDGFSKNLVTGNRDQAGDEFIGRGKLLYEPNADLKFTLAYSHSDIDDPYAVAQGAYHGISEGALLPGTIIATGPYHTSSNATPVDKARDDSVTLTGQYDMDGMVLKSLTSYRAEQSNEFLDSGKSSAAVQLIGFKPTDYTVTQEIDLSSTGTGPFQWTTGFYYFHDRSAYRDLDVTQGIGDGIHYAPVFKFLDAFEGTDSYSAFADGTYRIIDNLFLTGGVRLEDEKAIGSFDSILSGYSTTSANKTFRSVTPRAVLRYELTPHSNLYASYSRGYKAGVFNATGLSTTPVNPETINAYEVGYKVSSGGSHLELSGFYYDYKQLQFVSYVGPVSLLTNAASARIYGADGHLTQAINDELSLDVGGTYTNARYRSFPGAPDYEYSPSAGITVAPGDASGRKMIRTPAAIFRVAGDYHSPLFGGTGAFNISYHYQSSEIFDPFGVTRQGGYGILDLRASWTDPSQRYTFALYGRNLTNETYYTAVTQQSESFPTTYGEPINFGFELDFKL
jgi:iron complex outermembrane receptor protein